MRKFIVKNRPKRKYTKKNTSAPTSSLTKTLYEMLPLLIIVVAFIATILISLPFRESLTKLRFSLPLPQFSLTNPIFFLQTLWDDGIQVFENIGLLFSLLLVNCIHTIGAIENGTINVLTLLNPFPFFVTLGNAIVFVGNSIEKIIVFTLSVITSGYNDFSIGITTLFSIISTFISFIFTAAYSALLFITQLVGGIFTGMAQMIENTTYSLVHTIFQTIIVVGEALSATAIHTVQAIVYASEIVFHIIIFVIRSLISLISFIVSVIFTFIAYVAIAIFHIIEIPFKILYSFWLVIKPYVDIFLNHVQMTGTDFSKGVADLGNLPSALNSK